MKRWIAIAAAAAPWSCGSESAKTASSGDTAKPAAAPSTSNSAALTGAGATFPQPLYTKWISEYAAKTGVKINYQAIGSGGGIRQFSEGTVDFGATDAPMSDADIAKLKAPAFHIPTVAGVVALGYNLPEVTQPLKLTGPLIADIFLGKVTKWNDGRIASLNPGVKLPATDILVVHRSEGSGTTYIFSEYLSQVSPAWKSGPGTGKELQWPVGLAEAATAAAEAAMQVLGGKTDYRVSIVNEKSAAAYPIASFTWLLVSSQPTDAVKGKKLADFLRWALSDGQMEVASLDYAPLPSSLATKLTPRIDSIAGAPR